MNITRKNNSVPVRNKTDVLVVGGGPAGFGAAIAAARAGARVTLIEQGAMLGGMWTLGMLSPYFDNWNKQDLNLELKQKLQERGAWGGLWNNSFDHVAMAMLLDEYAIEHELDLMFCTMATEPVMEGNTLRGVIAENKSGAQAVLADVVIDCTGDGDIAARAGAPFEIGRSGDGVFQPMTMMFKIGGVRDDYPRDDIIGWYNELVRRCDEQELLREIPYNYPAIIRLPRRGEALLQWTHVKHHLGCDGEQLTDAVLEGRRQIRKAMKYLELIRPVLGEVYLLDLPSVIGVRETRRITGEYVISDEDVKTGRKQPDGICRVTFGVDIHEPEKPEQTCWTHPGFDIPFRSLVPLKVENLLTAGRCISGSFAAHAAYRVTGDCVTTGEAAGRAAARAVRENRSVRDLALSSR